VQYDYNRRVVECRLASALLSNIIARKTGRKIEAVRLSDLSAEKLHIEPQTLKEMAMQGIGERTLSLGAIAQRLGATGEHVAREQCTLRNGTVLREPPEGFRILSRYRHVITEAERVSSTVKALEKGSIGEVGELMNQSHASCRDDYEVSCPELEVLVSVARSHGALGARLTGAGFGGCTVNAVPSANVEQFVKGVTADYYEGYLRKEKGREVTRDYDLRDVIFPCTATAGATILPAGEFIS
jgi:galactokinase